MEVYHNGKWGTVCGRGWDLNDAQVVCKELGFGNAVGAARNAFYGRGRGSIWLSNLQCVGTEWSIGNCSQSRRFSCSHYEDAGVKCASGTYHLFGVTLCMYVCKINNKMTSLLMLEVVGRAWTMLQ